MSLLVDIPRRTFLVGSMAIVGGVAFGIYKYKEPFDNPLKEGLAESESAITSYIKVDQNGITLITPRMDMGQGAYSMQAAMIAEELDVELDQIKADPGPPARAYYNTALAAEGVPFPSTDESLAAETMRGMTDGVMKFIGLHITGGSSSTPDAYVKLRLAGAAARETFKKAAAKKSGVPMRELKTARGAVILPDGSELSYIDLASDAAKVSPASKVALRDPSDWRLIGKPMQRIDVVAKSTGTQDYGIDMRMEGMVHAAIKLNPRQGGEMRGFDAAKAETMRGVQKIVPVSGGVAVVADNTWRAFKAAEAITFDWGPAVFPATMEEHWQTLSDSFIEENLNAVAKDEGDAETAFSDGKVIEAEYRAPYVAHAPLEPINAVVKVTDERVDVWSGTQVPRFALNNVAAITGMPAEKIHVHVLMAGGSFGHRLEDEVIKQATEVAVAMKGTPVKLTYSREEDFLHDFVRQISMGRMKGSVKEGRVDALDARVSMPSVAASQFGRQNMSMPGPDPIIATGIGDQPFAIPHYRVAGYMAPALAPLSSWRSVGASTNAFFHEGFLDELIHEAGADPLQERIRLVWHEPSRKVLEAVGEMSGWTGPRPGPDKGRGVAFSMSFGVPVAEIVEVTNTGQGIRIDKVWIAADVGRIVDPVNFDNLVKGGVVWGLGHAMNCEITYQDGIAEQTNYHAHEGMRLYQCPDIEVKGLENAEKIRGIGEPPVPPAAPALANAIFAATGLRLREMPFNKHIKFV